MMSLARSRYPAGASEHGFGLIEVVVSAAVLVVVVLGVLAAIDSLSHTAAANQSRTVASTLAEKDLERLRGLRTEDLSRLAAIEPETHTVKVGQITYTITSKAQLVADTTGEDVSCSVPTGKGRYLRITSAVTSPMTGGAVKPVVMSSIVAPQPNKGTLTGLVHDARSAPVNAMPVQAIGPTPAGKPTNSLGCAVFGDAEAGSYTLRLDQVGWVNVDGEQLYELPGTVSPGNVTTVEFLYDLAGSFAVTVVNSAGQIEPATDFGLMADHTGVGTGFRYTPASPFTQMFPFHEAPYEVYSGNCTGSNPGGWIPGYYATHQPAVAQVNPGQVGQPRTVLEPSVNVFATYNSAAVAGATVYAYPRTDGCSPGKVKVGTTGPDGKSMTPGLPFGKYDLCIQYSAKVGNNTRTWRAVFTKAGGDPAITNTNPAGTSKDDAGNNLNAAFLSSAGSTGACGDKTPTTS
jgi:Tfp pilus assembly protein PilV